MFLAHNVQRVALSFVNRSFQRTNNKFLINELPVPEPMADGVHLSKCLHAEANDRGAILTTIFGTFESVEIKAVPVAPTPTKKRGWLPLLTILFMISYGLMTMLIVEQGQTIESQRALIRELFRDSTELSSVKMKAQQERAQALSQSQTSQIPSTQTPSVQNPSTQIQSNQAPSTHAPVKQAPSSQAEVQHRTQSRSLSIPQFQMPSKPASDLVDHRRALVTI